MQGPPHARAELQQTVSRNENTFEELDIEIQPAETGPSSTEFLDGLRGLAALLVYLQHTVPEWYGTTELEHGFGYHGERSFMQLPFIRILYAGGNPAVAVFFVLSGYVLSIAPLKLLQDGKRSECRKSLVSAFVRRPIRLFGPPLVITLLFAIAFRLPFAPDMGWPVPEQTLLLELKRWAAESLRMMDPIHPFTFAEHWQPYNPETWTMGFEYRGSLLVFGLIALSSYLPQRHSVLLYGCLAVLAIASYQWAMSCFLGGVTLCLNDREGFDRSVLRRCSIRVRTIIPHIAFAVALHLFSQPSGKTDIEISSSAWGFGLLTALIPPNYRDREYWRFYETIGAFLLVYSFLRVEWLQLLFSKPGMLYLGRISFSLYLAQYPFYKFIGEYVIRALGKTLRKEVHAVFDNLLPVPDIGPRGLSSGFLISQVMMLPMILFMANLVTRFLDRPSVLCSKWLAMRLGLIRK